MGVQREACIPMFSRETENDIITIRKETRRTVNTIYLNDIGETAAFCYGRRCLNALIFVHVSDKMPVSGQKNKGWGK